MIRKVHYLALFISLALVCAFVNGHLVEKHPAHAEPAFIVVDASSNVETRCGWFHNPTPANAWLIDAAGEWTIGVQGGHQAEGDWPDFPSARWVKTNINYGYGCACMKVTTDRAEKRVIRIHSGYSRPLSACRKDKALKGKEPR